MVCARLMYKENTSKDCDRKDNILIIIIIIIIINKNRESD